MPACCSDKTNAENCDPCNPPEVSCHNEGAVVSGGAVVGGVA